jgi:hypothetical protein
MNKLIYISLILSMIFVSCRKKNLHDTQSIRGNVRNNCTGGPFENVKVLFKITTEKLFGKLETQTLETRTDPSGNFEFSVEIGKSKTEVYAISIPGYSNYDTEFFGTGQEIPTDKLNTFHQFGVSATFKNLLLTFPSGTLINSPDTFYLTLSQIKLHSYEPQRVWQLRVHSFNGLNDTKTESIAGYPMGWWRVDMTKVKAGVQSQVVDSVYIGMGASATYVVPW